MRSEWLRRPRLWFKLEPARRAPVVLVAAPAGYGKTTLMTQWVAGQSSSAVAWLQLEPADNDPTLLWTRLGYALERTGCAVDANIAEFTAVNAIAIASRVVPRFIQALAQVERPLTLVLDDCHLLRSAECSEQLDQFAGGAPRTGRCGVGLASGWSRGRS